MFKSFVIASGLTSAAFWFASPAYSAITFCNHSDRTIYMALGAMNLERPDWGMTSAGWWSANSGECKVVYSSSINSWEWYGYYAISEDGTKVWPDQNPADNMTDLCVTDTSFNITNPNGYPKNCNAPSQLVWFKWFLTGQTYTNFTQNFTN